MAYAWRTYDLRDLSWNLTTVSNETITVSNETISDNPSSISHITSYESAFETGYDKGFAAGIAAAKNARDQEKALHDLLPAEQENIVLIDVMAEFIHRKYSELFETKEEMIAYFRERWVREHAKRQAK